MSDTKITAGWCEARADAAEKFAAAMLAVDATDSGALGFMLEAEALRLAARALKARERAESRREAYPLASDTRTEIAILLAILDGSEP